MAKVGRHTTADFLHSFLQSPGDKAGINAAARPKMAVK